MTGDLEMRRIGSDLETQVAQFFEVLARAGEERFFSPHPFTPAHARFVAQYAGRDFYGLALHDGRPVAYGLLRGWDEGFEVPSLGIGVHPEFRGVGLGLAFMCYLHTVAALRGTKRMRLRVHGANARARGLYERLGYAFEPDVREPDFLVGFVTLRRDSGSRA